MGKNVRVSASTIRHHLCFFCGTIFHSHADYQRHIVSEHQAPAIVYQMYIDDLHDGVKMTSISPPIEKRKDKEKKKRKEYKPRVSSTPIRSMERVVPSPVLSPYSLTKNHISPRPNILRAPSRQGGPSACSFCNLALPNGSAVVEHCVTVHQADIVGLSVRGFVGQTRLHETENPSPQDRCIACGIDTPDSTQWYTHTITTHKTTFFRRPEWTAVQFDTYLKYRDRPVVTVGIKLKRAG